jgi:hypothetical protein
VLFWLPSGFRLLTEQFAFSSEKVDGEVDDRAIDGDISWAFHSSERRALVDEAIDTRLLLMTNEEVSSESSLFDSVTGAGWSWFDGRCRTFGLCRSSRLDSTGSSISCFSNSLGSGDSSSRWFEQQAVQHVGWQVFGQVIEHAGRFVVLVDGSSDSFSSETADRETGHRSALGNDVAYFPNLDRLHRLKVTSWQAFLWRVDR